MLSAWQASWISGAPTTIALTGLKVWDLLAGDARPWKQESPDFFAAVVLAFVLGAVVAAFVRIGLHGARCASLSLVTALAIPAVYLPICWLFLYTPYRVGILIASLDPMAVDEGWLLPGAVDAVLSIFVVPALTAFAVGTTSRRAHAAA